MTMCNHTNFGADVEFEAYDDSNIRRLKISNVRCSHCGESIRFIGADEGHSLLRPSLGADAQTIFIPGVMAFDEVEVERRLAS